MTGCGAYQPLPHRLEHPLLFVRQLGEAKGAARVHQGMLADQVFDFRLGPVIQRIVGGAHVGEFGVSAGIHDDAAGQQRILRRNGFVGTVRVPELIAQVEQPAPVVACQRLVVHAEVRHVRHVSVEAASGGCDDAAGGGVLQRSEIGAERFLLVVGEGLVVKDQHGVTIHAGFQRRDLGRGQRPGDVDTGDFADEAGGQF